MKEQIISFETAKLAKGKGFNLPTKAYYGKTGNLHYPQIQKGLVNWNKSESYSAPTKSQLEEWEKQQLIKSAK